MATRFKVRKYPGFVVAIAALAVFGLVRVQAAGATTGTCSYIAANPSSPTDGQQVTLTGSVIQNNGTCPATPSGGTPAPGIAEIQEWEVNGNPVACSVNKQCTAGLVGNSCNADANCDTYPGAHDGTCTAAAGVTIGSGNLDSNGQVSTTFDTTGLGGSTLGFLTHYQAQGNFRASTSPCLPLVIAPATPPCTGATISADFAGLDGTPPPGVSECWSFRITVHACQDLVGVTAQGGTNGWSGFNSTTNADTGKITLRKQNKKNQVLLWTIGNMNAGQTATATVQVCGTTANFTCPHDPVTEFLNGPWSTTFSTDGGLTYQKSDYTQQVSIQVTCP